VASHQDHLEDNLEMTQFLFVLGIRPFDPLPVALLALVLATCSSSSKTPENPIGVNLTQVSADPYTIAPGQHATEVEPHMIANGSTLVAAFQTGRIVMQGSGKELLESEDIKKAYLGL